jgi:hypothetical protein
MTEPIKLYALFTQSARPDLPFHVSAMFTEEVKGGCVILLDVPWRLAAIGVRVLKPIIHWDGHPTALSTALVWSPLAHVPDFSLGVGQGDHVLSATLLQEWKPSPPAAAEGECRPWWKRSLRWAGQAPRR